MVETFRPCLSVSLSDLEGDVPKPLQIVQPLNCYSLHKSVARVQMPAFMAPNSSSRSNSHFLVKKEYFEL